MSSKTSQKKTSSSSSSSSTTSTGSLLNQDQVKLRRKESSSKNVQVDNQRKSGVFRFLHRDKKKNPELPEHGFIPDARRVLEGPSKSLTISPGINPIARNRWSSYEPVDFSKLSCNKTNNLPTELDDKDSVVPSQDASSDTRCFSNEFVKPENNNPCPTETFCEKEAECSTDQKPLSDAALGEKMKQIDEKLDAALKDRRVLVEKILKTPSKSFFGRPGLQPLLFESFLSSETLTKLVSQSMNSPGNAVTSEDMKVLKQTVLDLQRNLTLISEMICSDRKDKPDLPSPFSTLAKGSGGTCDERRHPMEILSADDIQATEQLPTTDASTGTTEYWPALEKASSLLPLESDDEVDEVLSKIDEENEETSTLERNSSPPIVPLETHPLNDELRLSSGHPVAFLEADLPQQAEASKLGLRKDKIINLNIRKSSSTTCFPELRIHSSIAEEDEETLCDDDARNEQSLIVNEVCLSSENVSLNIEETDVAKTFDDVTETIEPLIVEEQDSTFVKSDQGSFENKVDKLNALNEKILFREKVDGGEEQELQVQPCLTTFTDAASEANLKNSECDLASSVENKITGEEIEHRSGNEGGRERDRAGVDADKDCDTEEVCETIKFVNEQEKQGEANVVEVGLSITDERKPSLSKLSITKDSDSVCRTEDPNIIHAISDGETVKKGDFEITENKSQEVIGAFCGIESSSCGGEYCSQTLLTAEEVLHKPPEELRETVQNVEVFATVTEVTNEVVECFPREERLTIMEAPKMEIVEEQEVGQELKVENIEVLICNEERQDSLGSNDDASDTSTPVNSDACEPSQESRQEESNQNKEEGVVEISQVSLPSSNKTGNNKKRRNKKKKKNQQQQQQTNNSHEKDSMNIKETSLVDNKEAIVATSR